MPVRRITKDILLSLLNRTPLEILGDVNRTDFGFVAFLEKRRYTLEEDEDQILEIIVEILSRVCSVSKRYLARLDRFLRMLKDCQKFLFEDIPRLLHSGVTLEKNYDLIPFMCNCINILRTLLRKDFFPSEKILNDFFPTLENYINRLQERKIRNLDRAIECFTMLRNEVQRFEDPPEENGEEEDDPGVVTFRSLSVIPKSNDIINYEVCDIPHNIIDKAYKSVDHYLSVHYRLMREDMLRSFRECVKMYYSSNDKRSLDFATNQYFENVSVRYPPEYTTDGIMYYIDITTSKEVDWAKKGTLKPGSLVFLTMDRCHTFVFATIVNNPRVSTGKSKTCVQKIRLEDDQFEDRLLEDTRYTLIQPSTYFEGYKHVLSGIKEFCERNFPLADILSYFDFCDPEPEYLDREKYCLHEECEKVVEHAEKCCCREFDPLKEEWPKCSDLNDQQNEAFKIALTKKVAVIQGPPGTGKTHVAVKIVKTLLRNNSERKPIVISCLTNHALDQFLEKMLKYTKKIIRIGSQSKSKILEPHFLDNMMIAIHQFQDDQVTNDTVKKSLNLVEKIASSVLSQRIAVERDENYYTIKKLSQSINRTLQLHSRCLHKFLDDSALNDIIGSEYKSQLRRVSGAVEKTLSAAVLEWLVCSRSSDLYDKCRKKFSEISKKKINCLSTVWYEDIWSLTETKRFELFYCWRKKCLEIAKEQLDIEIVEYNDFMKISKPKSIDAKKVELLKGADIVGLTTTGACKYKELLKFSEPRIIVIEEAAQVLESHIIASLVPSIQHLILVGDHEQLRPLPADRELSEKYNLKISMFERLFNNGAPSVTLVTQHRMKPCIAELLVPRPYTVYESGENVHKYEEIKGVESSVFFFDHRTFEDENSSGTSSSNKFEAQMIAGFARYLTSICYSPTQITIIAAYAAQVNLIHNLLQEVKLEILVTTVDNYQGEENDIILISFVRSNPSVIGFLKESNRVCVALSRAKKGLFCFGNFQLFADKNDLWNGIVDKLREKNMIGSILSLKCPKHNMPYPAQSGKDILKFLARGCSEECKAELPCTHMCVRKCHFDDPDHEHYLCKEPCIKMIDETRVCPRLCCQKCKKVKRLAVILPCGHSNSKVDAVCSEESTTRLPCGHLVSVPCYTDINRYQCKSAEKVILDCGHKKAVWCYQKQENAKVICNELRLEIAPCGHTVEVPCHMQMDENDLLSFCNKACGTLLSCQHPCTRLCRLCVDTGIHGFCAEKCELVLSCGHKCDGFCGSPCPPCSRKCLMCCGHNTYCINDCLRPCVECEKPCERKCNHGKCSKLCWEDCSVEPCDEPCVETLPCGHRCIGLCGDPCPLLCRVCNAEELIDYNGNDDCLYVELKCEHVVEVSVLNEHIDFCLMSLEWPCCPRCSAPIFKSTRYKNKLKRAKKICIDSCDTSEEISFIQYLVECMNGIDFVVTAQFLPVHEEIQRILMQRNPKLHALMVLKKCVLLLTKLVKISPKLNECDESVQAKFDTLMLWIYYHLTEASFQQLQELQAAVTELTEIVDCKSSYHFSPFE